MGLTVFWTDFAKNELKKIHHYHRKKVSVKVAQQISTQIVESTHILNNLPESGAIEELLQEKPQNFRYILSTNYKIIYWINKEKNRIEVVDVFDTRQNPVKMKRNK
ncbi:type II toxin-antitoxin system RelE/ParE family toxin [Proteiniphilum sp.]|jgi:plasmid stabilization system protein ParE|uniref:type II toxin-antitoxin system RelE/ParE family toxin n=1 Tax=Proteiniphilum sp. TaxID=1926877 RepID=UPI00092A8B52|nr:MAG: plasmid stabilization protein [Bacteroidia bacterium 44-10]